MSNVLRVKNPMAEFHDREYGMFMNLSYDVVLKKTGETIRVTIPGILLNTNSIHDELKYPYQNKSELIKNKREYKHHVSFECVEDVKGRLAYCESRVKPMTLEDIESELGYKIEIIEH